MSTRCSVKPGDLIEWFYESNGKVVQPREMVWSSIEKRFVPVVGIHLLISIVNGALTFLTMGSDKGLLHAREDDTVPNVALWPPARVAPRARG